MSNIINSTKLRDLILNSSNILDNISQKLRKFSSPLINYTEPISVGGFTKTRFYTEVNTNLSIGDKVFIVNGNFDSNDLIKKDRYRAGNDGYRIINIDRCSITLDIDYDIDVPVWNEIVVDSHIKVYSCLSQDEAIYLSQIKVNTTGSEKYRFEYGNNSVIYSNATYNTPFGNILPGFSILSSGAWSLVTSPSLSSVLSGNNNTGKLVIMGEGFMYNNTRYDKGFVYTYKSSSWIIDHTYQVSMLSKSNFRSGSFDGNWSDGIFGSYDNKIVWEKKNTNTWSSGIAVNVNWMDGEVMSDSDTFSQNSFYSTLDSGLVSQSTDKSNNKGNGYNYFINCDFKSGSIRNGNFIGGVYGEAANSVVESHIQGVTYSTLLNVTGGKFFNTNILGGNFENIKLDSVDVTEGKFKNTSILNSHISNSVLLDSRFKADSSNIKINSVDKFFYLEGQKHMVRYKLYIEDKDISKLKNLKSFYLKGLKINKDSIFDRFENVFYMNRYSEIIRSTIGIVVDTEGLVVCDIKTKEENKKKSYFVYDTELNVFPQNANGLNKASLDITMEIVYPGVQVGGVIWANSWIDDNNRLDIFDNPFIVNAEFESGIMKDSTWEYGNIVNNSSYQINQYSDKRLNIINTSINTIMVSLKNNILSQNWIQSNISVGDIIHLDNIVYINSAYPPVSTSINGSYKVLSFLSNQNDREMSLEAIDQEAIDSLVDVDSSGIPGFYYTYDSSLNTSNAQDWYDRSNPNFMSISKIKIENTNIQSGIFVRTFFKNSTVYNSTFNNLDKNLESSNIDKLKLINFILTTDGNHKSKYFDTTDYSTENRKGNNIDIRSGFVYNSIINYPKWTNGIVHDSYWLNGDFNNGVAKKNLWMNGNFNNGFFTDSMSYVNGAIVPFSWTLISPNLPNFVSWMQSAFEYGWENGNFNNGEMSGSVWFKGNKYDGNIYNTKWIEGNHYDGTFGDSRYDETKNIMVSGHWLNGIVVNGMIGSNWYDKGLIWENGEFNGGQFYSNSATASAFGAKNMSSKGILNWYDTSLESGDILGLIVDDVDNLVGTNFNIGDEIFINKFSDDINTQYNTTATITNIIVNSGSVKRIVTNMPFGSTSKISIMESGMITKNYSVWKNGNFNSGYFTGNSSFWLNGNFNGGIFKSDLYTEDFSQDIVASGSYPPYDEKRHNFNYNWHNGNFNNGIFRSSWANGIWNNGVFEGKVWRDGLFINGEFLGSATASATLTQDTFNNIFNDPIKKFTGLWLNGIVVDDIKKLQKEEKTKTDLIRRKDEVRISNKVTFQNVMWKNGKVDHINSTFVNSMWLNGTWTNGTWQSGSFNPFVERPIGLYHVYSIGSPLSKTDYTSYPGSNGYSNLSGSVSKFTFESSDTCIWKNGIWEDGDFSYSIWKSGLWKNGTMNGGIWENGTWWYGNANNIIWKNGLWRNGNWDGSGLVVKHLVDGSGLIQATSSAAYGQVGHTASKFVEILINNKNVLTSIDVSTPTRLNIWNMMLSTNAYHDDNNGVDLNVVTMGSDTVTIPLSGWTYSKTVTILGYDNNNNWFYPNVSAPQAEVLAKLGNGRFLGGVWENGVWNSGYRRDIASNSFDYAKNVEFEDVIEYTSISRGTHEITIIRGATFSGLFVGDEVAIGNIVSIDINSQRKLIKSKFTVSEVSSDKLSFKVRVELNFPIYQIIRDSNLHRVLVSKNIWHSGAFLNGVFAGVWNGGLIRGFPYITHAKDTSWIDGIFDGGRFSVTSNGATSTGLIQKMDFNDMSSSVTTTSDNSYLSWMDVNYDNKYVSNIFMNHNTNVGNKTKKTNHQGFITHDILESNSSIRDKKQKRRFTYNLGTKYTKYTDFIGLNSEFNGPVLEDYGWTYSTIGSVSIYQGVTSDSAAFPEVPSLFVNKGDALTGASGYTPSANSLVKINHLDIEVLSHRYTMVEFDCLSWSGVYSNRNDVYTSSGSECLFFNYDMPFNPVKISATASTKYEFFYNRTSLDMYMGGTFSAVLDNIKFYETDMIPFLRLGTETSINKNVQIPYNATAPFIDYSDQNFSFIDNIVFSPNSIVSGGLVKKVSLESEDSGSIA